MNEKTGTMQTVRERFDFASTVEAKSTKKYKEDVNRIFLGDGDALVADMEELLEKIASKDMLSRHSQTWGDDNGFSHLRASLMGPGITVPVDKGSPVLGTWQQIVVIDHDNRPRERKVYIQVMGTE